MQFSNTAPRTLGLAGVLLMAGMAVAGITTYTCGKVLAAHQVDVRLDDGRLQRQQVLGQRFQRLRLMSDLMAGDASFVSYVLEASSASNDPFGGSQGGSASVKDLLTERRDQIGFDFGMVLDLNGGVVAATGGTGQVDLSTDLQFTGMTVLGTQLLKQNALPQQHFNLAFAGEHWLVYADPLGSDGDSGVMLTLISYDQVMADIYTVLKLLLVEILVVAVFTAAAYVWLKKRPVASPAWPTRPPR